MILTQPGHRTARHRRTKWISPSHEKSHRSSRPSRIAALAQQLAPPQREIALYPGVAPGSENWDWSETQITTGMPMVQNVVHSVLQYYPADKNTAVGTAMIVAPGGGFRNLMMSYEGVDVALRLNAVGIDAFVLKYRLT
jgi:hypothetical protein